MSCLRVMFALLLFSTIGCGDDEAGDATGDTGAEPGEPTMARLHGVVTRSVEPSAGGIGDVYIAVFDDDPVLAMDTAQNVANGFIEAADLSAPDAEVAYEIPDIPVQDEPYYLVAFLDDNGTVDQSDPDNAGPDMGDLLSLRGLASPSVVLDVAGDFEFDIDLNSVLPF